MTSRFTDGEGMNTRVLSFKKVVKKRLNRSRLYNKFEKWRLLRRIDGKGRFYPSFSDLVSFEYARCRLGKLAGYEHPHVHFQNKVNQRGFMSIIGAPLPEAYVTAPGEWGCLNDGSYFVKPAFGCSAKGCYPIDIKDQRVYIKGHALLGSGLSVPKFMHWYNT